MKSKSLIARESGKPFIARDGALIFELFRKSGITIKNLSIATGFLKPLQKAIPHYHKISEEIYYVLHGVGRVRVGNFSGKIKAGDTVYIPIRSIHALENTNKIKSLKVIAISSPPYKDSDIFFVEN